MPPSTQRSQQRTPIVFEIAEDRSLATIEGPWDDAVTLHAAPSLRREVLVGRSLDGLIDGEQGSVLMQWIDSLLAARGDRPPERIVLDHPLPRGLSPWPLVATDGRVVGVRLTLRPSLHRVLSRPLFVRSSGRLEAVNRAARLVLDSADGPTRRQVEDSLSRYQPARYLVPTGLKLDDGPLLSTRLPAGHGDSGWSLLAKIMRAGLHDLSNPLAGAQMLADVLARAEERRTQVTVAPSELLPPLQQTHTALRILRSVLHADLGTTDDLASTLDDALLLLRSELDRFGVALDLELEACRSIEHRRSELLPFLLGLLLASVHRAGYGDRLTLSAETTPPGRCRLSLRATPAGEPEIAPEFELDFDFFIRWASDLGAELVLAPGERPSRDPDWQVDLGPLA